MSRCKALLLFLFLLLSINCLSQKEISVNYFSPCQYKTIDNHEYVKSWLDSKETGKEFIVSLDGKQLQYSKTDSGKVVLFLPLAGKEGELVFSPIQKSKNKVLTSQIFRPLIPSDWGSYNNIIIHIFSENKYCEYVP